MHGAYGCKFDIAMSQAEHEDFIEQALQDPQGVFHKMLGDISSKKSSARSPEDQEVIHTLITKVVGFGKLD